MTAEEMFQYLETVYLDPNQLINIKIEFQKLVMWKNNNYYKFLTKFLYLATETAISESNYKFKLNGKLAFNL